LVAAAVAAFDWPYDALRGVLTEQSDGAILMLFIPYPTHGTRILGMVIALVCTAAACRFGYRIPGGLLPKALLSITAAAVVALIVSSHGLSWAHEANLAFRRWILGLVAVVLAGATVASLAPAILARARSRQ
jgi:hypothetical protein